MLDTGTGQQHVDSALDTILDRGVLGAICVLLGFALFFALRGWLKEKDFRVTDQKEMSKALGDLNNSLRDLVVETNKGASNLVIDASRSADTVKNALQGQQKELGELRTSVNALQQEQVRLGLGLHPEKRR